MTEKEIVQNRLKTSSEYWSIQDLEKIAHMDVPHSFLGRQRTLLKGDINELWVRWFIESIADPWRYLMGDSKYSRLYNDILREVPSIFFEMTGPERQEIAISIARYIFKIVQSMKASNVRKPMSSAEKILLLELAGNLPGCWICGWKFPQIVIDNFMEGTSEKVPSPSFVDVFKPRGLKSQDLRIEVDHILPFSHGGENENNLKLACGWCNRYKSSHLLIYDVEGHPIQASPNNFGISSIPQPFWIVRLLALKRKCEHPTGCQKTVENSELTVMPIRECGALNPTNLRLTCFEHLSPVNSRFLSPNNVKKIHGIS
ncbi:MAG: HNH endonuclease [Leptospirillum sp.]